MNLQKMLESVLLWGFCPLWLAAGAADYLCHRQTGIEHTSGAREAYFHVVQFFCLLPAFSAAVLMRANALVFALMVVAVSSHSLLAYLDVSYTDGRRYVSPVEQQVHSFMDILPLRCKACPYRHRGCALRLAAGDWRRNAAHPMSVNRP